LVETFEDYVAFIRWPVDVNKIVDVLPNGKTERIRRFADLAIVRLDIIAFNSFFIIFLYIQFSFHPSFQAFVMREFDPSRANLADINQRVQLIIGVVVANFADFIFRSFRSQLRVVNEIENWRSVSIQFRNVVLQIGLVDEHRSDVFVIGEVDFICCVFDSTKFDYVVSVDEVVVVDVD
jgi:hypothetical protein